MPNPVDKGSSEVHIPERPMPRTFRNPETAATINETDPKGHYPEDHGPRPPSK